MEAEHVTKIYRLGEPRSVFSLRAIPSLFRKADRGRQLTALEDVSFRIEPGETVGLIGPNGTGKSTLLRILTGVTVPSSGRVRSAGRMAAVLELGSGFYDELTAYDNTFLNAQLLGMSRTEVKRKLDEIFGFAELQDFVHAPMRQYSFGMRLRLAFSIAMALEPDLLLLDEVMGVGDLQFQRRSAARVRELAQQGATLVVVSHHLSDLTRVCQRGLLLRGGRLVADGPIQQTLDTYLEGDQQEPVGSARQEGTNDQTAAGGPAATAVEISSVDVLGESGREQLEFHTGELVTIRLTYRSTHPLDRPIFGLAIYREDGLYMAHCSTDASGFHTGRVQGAGQVQLLWECPFTTAGYRITATITDSTGAQILAQAHSVAGFEVLPRPGFSQGAIRLDGQWTVTSQ